ncbi:hypothetical protein ACHWQZ_G011230 [Mnemiopsis leidyi]
MENVSTTPIPDMVLTLDKILSLNLLLGLILGVPANIISLYYFCVLCKGRDIPTQIYRRICVVDLVTCLAHLPVMVSMWSAREPVLFGNQYFCIGWRILFRGLQVSAIFLVLLLSLSRAIAICFPFTVLYREAIVWSFRAYLLFIILQNAALRSEQIHVYNDHDVFCYEDLGPNQIYGKIDDQLYEIEIGLPTFLIIISFISSVYKLRKSDLVPNGQQSTKKQASVTIMIVTGIFLICNLPQCINMLLWIADYDNMKENSSPRYRNTFMMFYTWNISAVQTVVLSAYLSPIVYFSRMQSFRDWVMGGLVKPGKPIIQPGSVSSVNVRNRLRSVDSNNYVTPRNSFDNPALHSVSNV